LEVHGYEEQRRLDPAKFGLDENDEAIVTLGRLFSTYEYHFTLGTEFGTSDETGYRDEGSTQFVQGPVAVLIHPKVTSPPIPPSEKIISELERFGCQRLLVFANVAWDLGYLGAAGRAAKPLTCVAQGLESLGFNILTATNVFLEFRHQIQWQTRNYLLGAAPPVPRP
jgi:hypothetical protein